MKSQERSAVRALPEQELELRLKECEEKLFKLKFANSVSPLKNGLQIQDLRRQRARLLTWIRQRQTVQTGEMK